MKWSTLSFLLGAAAGALVLGGVWGAVAIGQAQQSSYEACLIDQGFYPGDPATDLDGLVEATELCS